MATQAGNRGSREGASPYSTGGGGVVLEHEFGATLLAALLMGNPVPGLGDEQSVVQVGFQVSQFSPVDDLMIVGETRGTHAGAERRIFVGVRRNPQFIPSSKPFVKLLADYVQAAQGDWPRIVDGSLRLGLAVAKRNAGVEELDALTGLARAYPDFESFRDAANAAGHVSGKVRHRLVLLDETVAKAAEEAGVALSAAGQLELTWRLLFSLRVIETRLEGSSAPDRTATVANLRAMVGEAQEADSLFTTLARLAGNYAPAGAIVTEATLRRDLRSHAQIERSPSYQRGWQTIDLLEQQLKARTRGELSSGSPPRRLVLRRATNQRELAAAMVSAGANGKTLAVTGAPDVGKSSLALAAMDTLDASAATVIAFSLRDLPTSVPEIAALLGAPLATILGASAVAASRLLVIDGAEAALEGRTDSLRHIVEAADSAGIGLVAITRSDALEQVLEAISDATSSRTAAVTIEIPSLRDGEVKEVIASFPELERIAHDPRSALLLTRPGLVDLLLKADAVAALPNGALSEADVFNAVWRRLVRRSERRDPGAGTPDARQAELLNLARRKLRLEPVSQVADANALPSLRSDGLLLAPGPAAAWNTGDEFASDLVRDFAIARLLIVDGLEALPKVGAPRWALRAARLACQARLGGEGAPIEDRLREVEAFFDGLAADFGDRWADVPLEALLTLGSPRLDRVWAQLLANGTSGLDRMLRIIDQRFNEGGVADPVLAEPVIQQVRDHPEDVEGFAYDTGRAIDQLELHWLRGLAIRARADKPNPLRRRIRDRLLAADLRRSDERAQECLALLGPDLSEAAEAHLRRLAAEAPHELAPCVNSPIVSVSMATHRADLLLYLAESYFIDDRSPFGHGAFMHEGIRDHHSLGGFGRPMAAWWYGPFFSLLQVRPKLTVAFINRMLEHAARCRVRELCTLGSAPFGFGVRLPNGPESLPAIEVDIPGAGRKHLVGDDHVWSWYRGTTVGPMPCMSALFAVERFVDWIHTGQKAPASIAAFLLTEGQSMAMVGLTIGFLLRHLDDVTVEMDSWLANPVVWELEFSRLTHEAGLAGAMMRGRDFTEAPMPIFDAAGTLAMRTLTSDCPEAAARLASVADELVQRASAYYSSYLSEPELGNRMETARRWASILRVESYPAQKSREGLRIQHRPPPASQRQEAERIDFDQGTELLRIFNVYAIVNDRRPADLDGLPADLSAAARLSEDPPTTARFIAADALAAVAATAVIAYADGQFRADEEGIRWAIQIVLEAALSAPTEDRDDPGLHDSGADRSAAIALPCLLLPPFNEEDPSWSGDEDLSFISDALRRLCTSGCGEVRRRAAVSLDRLWLASCTPNANRSQPCRHALAFAAVQAAARLSRMGPFDMALQRRPILPLEGDLHDSLEGAGAEDLLVSRLAPALVASCASASSECCVAAQARALRDTLLRAYARAAIYWMRKHHQLDHNPEGQRIVAEAIFKVAARGELDAILRYADALTGEPTALSQFLGDLAGAATYVSELREALPNVWPSLMSAGLDAVEGGRLNIGRPENRDRDDDELIASLLPTPGIRFDDQAGEATLRRARQEWISTDAMRSLVERWQGFARGRPRCVDSLVAFIETLAPSDQATQGRWGD